MVSSVRLHVFFCQGEHEISHSNCCDVLCVSFVRRLFICLCLCSESWWICELAVGLALALAVAHAVTVADDLDLFAVLTAVLAVGLAHGLAVSLTLFLVLKLTFFFSLFSLRLFYF